MCLCLCWGCSSVIEFSPSVCKVLGSILSNPARQPPKSVYLFCLCNHGTEQERSAISSKKLSRIFPDKNFITFFWGGLLWIRLYDPTSFSLRRPRVPSFCLLCPALTQLAGLRAGHYSASVPSMTFGLGRAETMPKETSKTSLVPTAASPGPVQDRLAGSDGVSTRGLTRSPGACGGKTFLPSHWLAVVCLWWPSDKS